MSQSWFMTPEATVMDITTAFSPSWGQIFRGQRKNLAARMNGEAQPGTFVTGYVPSFPEHFNSNKTADSVCVLLSLCEGQINLH